MVILLERFIESIRLSLRSENWLAAIFMALAMPDICRSVERPVIGRGEIGHWYEDWVSRYIESKYIQGRFEETKFYAHDFWLFRCSSLHSGLDANNKKRMMKFFFTPPPGNGSSVHLNFMGDRLNIQVDIFCEDMIAAVMHWLAEMGDDPEIAERIDSLIKVEKESFSPFIHFG